MLYDVHVALSCMHHDMPCVPTLSLLHYKLRVGATEGAYEIFAATKRMHMAEKGLRTRLCLYINISSFPPSFRDQFSFDRVGVKGQTKIGSRSRARDEARL